MAYLGHMSITSQEGNSVPEFSIHDRLRKAREHAGLEQGALAERIDVSRQTVGNYELGRTPRPKKLIVRQWALACGVNFDWLWEGAAHPDERGHATPSGATSSYGQNGADLDIRAA